MNNKKTSELIKDIYNKNTGDKITIHTLIKSAESGGFGLAIFLSSLPILIPTPPPLPSIAAIPLIFFSIQMLLGMKSLWVPNFIGKASIERKTLSYLIEKSSKYIIKIESMTKKRILFIHSEIAMKLLGVFIFLMSLSILIPLPLTNFLPGISILFISFGILSKDGIITIMGIINGVLGLTFTSLVLIFGKNIIKYLLS